MIVRVILDICVSDTTARTYTLVIDPNEAIKSHPERASPLTSYTSKQTLHLILSRVYRTHGIHFHINTCAACG